MYHLVEGIIRHSKQISNHLIKDDGSIKTQGQKHLVRCDGQSPPSLMFVFQNGGECDNRIFPEAKPQTKIGVVIFFLRNKPIPQVSDFSDSRIISPLLEASTSQTFIHTEHLH